MLFIYLHSNNFSSVVDTTIEELRVLQYDCVEHPKPEIMESQMNNHILTVIGICPYMPTSFKDFVRLVAHFVVRLAVTITIYFV